MDSLVDYWGVVAGSVAGLVTVGLYFVKNWRDVEALKVACQTQERITQGLAGKIDDYHVSAVAREQQLRRELELRVEQVRTEALQQNVDVRREMAAMAMSLGEKLANIDKLLALVDERTKTLSTASHKQDERNVWADRILARLDTSTPTSSGGH
jgi:predicted trehalose synthase